MNICRTIAIYLLLANTHIMCESIEFPHDISYLWTEVKQIHDSIHGGIALTNFAMRIIDNPMFQRLRGLKQLGTCNYVFPDGGVHTRFEHSIGTYYLANKLVDNIVDAADPNDINNYLATIPELENYYTRTYSKKIHLLDDYIKELCKIAALCHDVGHGPFSHIFDDVFLPATCSKDHPNASHETRSGLILELIIKNDPILSVLVMQDDIDFIKSLINPDPSRSGFIYQIVSNTLNGLDVDKYDYIMRDSMAIYGQSKFDYSRLVSMVKIIDNNIVYPEQALWDIYELFQLRHKMHRQVYCHKSVIAAQYLIIELFFALDPILHISDSISDMDTFCKLDDEYILQSVKFLKMGFCHLPLEQREFVTTADNVISRLNTHQFYAFVDSHITSTKLNITPLAPLFGNDPNVVIFQTKVGYVSGNKKNPLDDIFVYKTKFAGKSEKIYATKKNKEDITAMMPATYQEYITMIFYKDKTNIARIRDIKSVFEDFIKSC